MIEYEHCDYKMLRVRVYRTFIASTSHTFNVFHNFNFPQISHYSTSSTSSSNDLSNYLENSLGFSHQQAITTSTKLSKHTKVNYSQTPKNAVYVVNLLKNHGFTDAQIRNAVKLSPRLLTYDADKTIKPKLGFLIDHGFSEINLIEVIAANPRILHQNVESLFSPAIQVLREILVSDKYVIRAIKRLGFSSFNGVINNMSPNVALLMSYGVPIESIRQHFVRQPGAFLRNPDTFKDVVIKVGKKLGNLPNSTVYLNGIRLFSSFSEENIDSKCRVFRSFGWTQTDIETLMMKFPPCFTLSDENIKKKLGFLMNDVGLEAAFLSLNSKMLNSSLEKKMLPRHEVLQILKAEGLLNKCPRLITVMKFSDSRFVKNFVQPFKVVHQVYARHVGCSVETLLQEHASDLQ